MTKFQLLFPLRWLSLSLLWFWIAKSAAEGESDPSFNRNRTISIGMVVFPGFEPLDIYGPLELFFSLSFTYKMTLSIIASTVGPVTSAAPPHRMMPDAPLMDLGYMLRPSLLATHTFETAPALDVLLVPGGLGNVILEQQGDTSVEDFIARRFDQLDFLLSVCTGTVSLAKAGVLEGRRATSNKSAFMRVSTLGKNVTWVPTARWVVDGKVWSSSGVTAGMDMTYAFLAHLYGKDDPALIEMMNLIEYAPHTDPHWDPFSLVYKIPGATATNGSIADCVVPVGYEAAAAGAGA